MWPWSRRKEEKPAKAPAIGIDLGTTRSCVAFWCTDRKRPKVISTRGPPPQSQIMRTIPSVVGFSVEQGKGVHVLVGETAKLQASVNPGNTISNAKRLIGRKFDDQTVQEELKYFPFTVVSSGEQNEPFIQIMGGKNGNKEVLYSAEDISSMILLEMKNIAERYLRKEVTDVVITVPAYFNRNQRRATRTAGEVVGLKVLQIISEPTAAAMAYGLHIAGSKLALVVDFGGGTLDVSLLRIDDGKFDVQGVGGDSHLGGEDIDNNLVEHFAEKFKQQSGGVLDVFGSPAILTDLKDKCEELKCNLSKDDIAQLTLKVNLAQKGKQGGTSFLFKETLTREEFVQMNKHIFDKCLAAVEAVLQDTNISPSAVDEVVLVGGSTRIPELRKMLSEYFGGKELCLGVNPDEAVAEGAAIQAAVLSGVDESQLRDILMLDKTPLSIGLKDGNGDFCVLIPKHTSIPTIVKKQFRTATDNQPAITVKIFEGEHSVAEDNVWLGYFDFPVRQWKGAKAGERVMEVEFEITADGLLRVAADTINVPTAPLLGSWSWGFLSFYIVIVVACIVAFLFKVYREGLMLEAPPDDVIY